MMMMELTRAWPRTHMHALGGLLWSRRYTPAKGIARANTRSDRVRRKTRHATSRDGCGDAVYAPAHVLHGPQATFMALFALVTGLALGCGGGWKGNTFHAHRTPASRARLETTYAFGSPSGDWREVRNAKNVQVAWVRPDIAGAIEIHAQCAEHGDSGLHEYTDHLRIDWTGWNIVEQRELRFLDRAALRTVVDAELDGVPRRNELLVFKKNGCLFDLRYSASPAGFSAGRAAFEQVLAGFRFPL